MKIVSLLLLFASTTVVGGSSVFAQGSQYVGSSVPNIVEVAGIKRTYRVYVPSRLAAKDKAPLLFVFHGGGGTGAQAERVFGMNTMADKYGFIVVYPDGLNRHWHDGRIQANPGIDDIAFVASLIEKLGQDYAVDKKLVYACGISNGALFSHYLALKLSDHIKAIAAVAGAIPVEDASLSADRPVSVLMIHGTADDFIPLKGGFVGHRELGTLGGKVLSNEETLAKWLYLDGGIDKSFHQEIPSIDKSTPAQINTYVTKSGALVENVVIENGGHTWPGHVTWALRGIDGITPMNIDASELISRFFMRTKQKDHPN